MRRRIPLLATSCAAAAAIAAGCGGGGAGGGAPAGAPEPIVTISVEGGFASMEIAGARTRVRGRLFADVQPPVTYVVGGDGACSNIGGPTTEPGHTYVPKSIGDTLVVTGPDVTLSATSNATGSFDTDIGLASTPDSDYTFSGSLPVGLGTVHAPKKATLSGTPVITPGQTATISYSRSGGSYVSIQLDGNANFYCNAPEQGPFVVPTNVTAAVGASPVITLRAISLHRTQLDGRDVLLEAIVDP